MRTPDRTRALVCGTVLLGAAALAAAVARTLGAPLAPLALLAAAVVLTELIQVQGDGESPEPLDGHPFSFSTGVHLAAVVIVGPWQAALVAAFGVLVVDGIRGEQVRRVPYNASVFALAALAGGGVFELLGGTPGSLMLPHDALALIGLGVTSYAINMICVGAVIAASSGAPLRPLLRSSIFSQLPSAAGELGLGIALASMALYDPWASIALLPLVLAVYRAHASLAALRSETTRSLETFANIVDERDPYTYRHSARVAEYVEELAVAVGLPATAARRLRWAGRLHDLGKIAVDSAVLTKEGALDAAELEAIRMHPRLSARLLRCFRFASDEARAVEYHHERADGRGYYGIDNTRIPLAAHFLIVADSYDAMTTDRPYRAGLREEVALGEIEKNTGTQFHPAVARAFVAVRRGLNPREVLTAAELAELQVIATSSRRRLRSRLAVLRWRPELAAAAALIAGLGAAGAGLWPVVVVALAGAVLAVAAGRLESRRVRRLSGALESGLAAGGSAEDRFSAVLGRLSVLSEPRWAAVVDATRVRIGGEIVRSWGDAALLPFETALVSWLARGSDGGTRPIVAGGHEIGRNGTCLAVPLVVGGETAGHLVLGFAGRVSGTVEKALGACGASLAAALLDRPTVAGAMRLAAVS